MQFPDLGTLLQNISTQVDDLIRLVTAIGFLSGLVFAIRSLFFFKQYGETRAGGNPVSIFKPVINMVVAIALLYFPTMARTMTTSLLEGTDDSAALAWLAQQDVLYSDVVAAAAKVMQLVGWIAFIRGWVLLVRIGEQGGQRGEFAKAILFIIGGILCINVYTTFGILINTLLGTS